MRSVMLLEVAQEASLPENDKLGAGMGMTVGWVRASPIPALTSWLFPSLAASYRPSDVACSIRRPATLKHRKSVGHSILRRVKVQLVVYSYPILAFCLAVSLGSEQPVARISSVYHIITKLILITGQKLVYICSYAQVRWSWLCLYLDRWLVELRLESWRVCMWIVRRDTLCQRR